jgi:alpha/beta superfamily hydrolase
MAEIKREEHVTFRSGELTLEGLFARPAAGASQPGAVVCHPHPLYGGSMHNNVVEAVLAAMWSLGYATLRFNFRGVGASEGEHDRGRGERDDADAALAFLVAQPGVRKDATVLAGYSFGAMVAMGAGLAADDVARVVAVALPVAMGDLSAGGIARKPVLLVSGDSDSYSPVPQLRSLQAALGKSARLEVIAGTDHFFGGKEDELAAAIAAALGEP